MSIGLRGDGFAFNLSYDTWADVLELAGRYGWEPVGTINYDYCNAVEGQEPERLWSWRGGYCSSDFQTVTADDARALAGALTRALDELLASPTVPVGWAGVGVEPEPGPFQCDEMATWPGVKSLLRDVIGLANAGAFTLT